MGKDGKGLPNWRIARYADDFVVLVIGACEHVDQLHTQIAKNAVPTRSQTLELA